MDSSQAGFVPSHAFEIREYRNSWTLQAVHLSVWSVEVDTRLGIKQQMSKRNKRQPQHIFRENCMQISAGKWQTRWSKDTRGPLAVLETASAGDHDELSRCGQLSARKEWRRCLEQRDDRSRAPLAPTPELNYGKFPNRQGRSAKLQNPTAKLLRSSPSSCLAQLSTQLLHLRLKPSVFLRAAATLLLSAHARNFETLGSDPSSRTSWHCFVSSMRQRFKRLPAAMGS